MATVGGPHPQRIAPGHVTALKRGLNYSPIAPAFRFSATLENKLTRSKDQMQSADFLHSFSIDSKGKYV